MVGLNGLEVIWPVFLDEQVNMVRYVSICDWYVVVLSPFGDGLDKQGGVECLGGVVGRLAMVGGDLVKVMWKWQVGHGGGYVSIVIR